MDADMKKELAASLRRIAEGTPDAMQLRNRIREEADRLDPPKREHTAMHCFTCGEELATHSCAPKREPVWPKRIAPHNSNWNVATEVYPAGVIGPVVEALRRIDNCFSGPTFQDTPLANGKAALAAFDAACQGEK